MATRLKYVINYVGNMDDAIKFHEEILALKLRFRSPHWTEFDTGETTLALHPATAENAAGTCQMGFGVGDLQAFFAQHSANGVRFVSPPAMVYGQPIAALLDSDGAGIRVSGDRP